MANRGLFAMGAKKVVLKQKLYPDLCTLVTDMGPQRMTCWQCIANDIFFILGTRNAILEIRKGRMCHALSPVQRAAHIFIHFPIPKIQKKATEIHKICDFYSKSPKFL